MRRQVTIPVAVAFILKTLEEKGFEAYVVGGAVRDSLLGKEGVVDWDVTTSATPDEVLGIFAESFYDNNFGTVMVAPKHIAHQAELKSEYEDLDVFDITTFRSEDGYTDKRRPDRVVWGKSLEEDVKRRDFTINAMALKMQSPGLEADDKGWVEVECEVMDYHGGLEDLQSKLVRTVGDANRRFGEDALRMMRAIRIGSELSFGIEEQTLVAIGRNAQALAHISWERIRDELMKILASDFPADGIGLLYSSGLLDYILPELLESIDVEQGGHHIYDVWRHSLESLRTCPSKDPVVRLATLLHDVGKPRTMVRQGPRGVTFYGHEVVGSRMVKKIADRLKLSNKQKEKLFILVRWHMFAYQPEMTDSAIRRFIRRVGVDNINDMMMLRIGDRQGGGSKATSWRLRELQRRIGENLYEPMGVKDLKIDGHVLMEKFGLKPGPLIGKVLNRLFEEVMDEWLENDTDKLIARAEMMINEVKSNA